MSKSSLRLANLFSITLIVVLAGVLRFSHLDLSPIGTSQSFLLRVAAELVNKGKWPLAAGQNAAGVTIPPLIEYLLEVSLLVRREILTAVHFQALLSLLAVLLLYLYGRALFGRQVALVAAFLLAVHPWAVYSGRVIAPEHAGLFWGVIAVGSLLMLVRYGRFRWHLLLAVVALTALTQLYFRLPVILLAVVTLLFLVVLAGRGKETASARWWLVAIGAALFLYLPYWRFERTTGYANLRALWAGWTGETAVTDGAVFTHLWQLADGSSLFRQFPAWETAVWPWFWLGSLLAALFAVGWLVALLPAVWQWRQKYGVARRAKVTAVLALWVLLGVLAFLHHAPPLTIADLLFLLPAICLLVALAIPPLTTSPVHQRKTAVAVVGLAIVLVSSGWLAHGNWAGLQAQDAGDLSWGPTVREVTTAVAASRAHLASYPDCELIILGPGNQQSTSPWGVMAEFVYPTTVRFVEQGRGFIASSRCSLYFVAGEDAFAAQWLTQHGQALSDERNFEPAPGRFYYVPGQEAAVAAGQTAWRNGLYLQSVAVPATVAAGERLQVTYSWQVLLDPLSGSQFQFFNHLLDENGEIVAQEDGPGIPTTFWQPGDTLFTHFYLQLPADLPSGNYTLVVGLYTWPDLQRIRLRHSLETAAPLATVTIP
ncbi:MAG: hypothetical protein CL608_01475 [Anaerolineaceae bacterium]|nr:hypothetical protein [Anaerolineaceae bacterium]